MKNHIINSTLAAKFSLHSDRQLDKATRISELITFRLQKLYGQIKWQLHNKKTNAMEKRSRIRALLIRVAEVAFETMADGLEDMAHTSHAEASSILTKSVPAGHLSLITEKPIAEALTKEQEDQIKDAVFEPMTSEKVNQIVKGTTAGASWSARLAQQTSLAPPDHLAALVTTGYLQGETPASLAAKIKPFVQGVASTANRVARNESMRIAHESRMEAYDDLGDMVIGFQIHATMDSRVRPHHAARSGTIYYKKPKAGQLGMDKMPRPPIEEDGTVAHNCRCWITPVLEIQSQIEDDPAAKKMFSDNKDNLIPNPAVYTQWFKTADIADQRKVVGAGRIAAVQARIGNAPINWGHFVNPTTGKLLDIEQIKNETEEERKKRLAKFSALMAERKRLTNQVYNYGYLPPKPPKPPAQPIPVPKDPDPQQQQIQPTQATVYQNKQYSDIQNYPKVGGQKGSNPGGTYTAADGSLVYIKQPKSESHAENEILASKLYSACGINSVEVHKGEKDGRLMTVSPIVTSTGTLAQKSDDIAIKKQLQSGFAVDCWLANWDVVGSANDNVIIGTDGRPVRVDPGGALMYRAQGGAKGAAFSDTVQETKTLLNANTAPQASKIFGDMTIEEQKESAKKLLSITPELIDDLVSQNISDPKEQKLLKAKLIARREDILKQYGLDEKAPEEPKQEPTPEPKPEPKPQPKLTPTLVPPPTFLDLSYDEAKKTVIAQIKAIVVGNADIMEWYTKAQQLKFVKNIIEEELAFFHPKTWGLINFASPAKFNEKMAVTNSYIGFINGWIELDDYLKNAKSLPAQGEQPAPLIKTPKEKGDLPYQNMTLGDFDQFLKASYKNLANDMQNAGEDQIAEVATALGNRVKQDAGSYWASVDFESEEAYFSGFKIGEKYNEIIRKFIRRQPKFGAKETGFGIGEVVDIYTSVVKDMVFDPKVPADLTYAFVLVKMRAANPKLSGFNWDQKINPSDPMTFKDRIYWFCEIGTGMQKKVYTGLDTDMVFSPDTPYKGKSISQQDIEKKRMNSPITHENYLEKMQPHITPQAIDTFMSSSSRAQFFQSYLGGGYRAINDELLNPGSTYHANAGKTKSSTGFKTKVAALKKDIQKHGVTIPTGTVLHRGGFGFDIGTHVQKGFLSTSVDYEVASGFHSGQKSKKMYTIIVSEPIKAVPVRALKLAEGGYAEGNAYREHEILFPPDCQMVVTGKIYPDGSWEMLLYAAK